MWRAGQQQQIICYLTPIVGARPGGPNNRLQRMRRRPWEPDRSPAASKPKRQAVGACRGKLVMLCYGVLKNRAAFDPDWASKKAA
jgi:hypothetical protein